MYQQNEYEKENVQLILNFSTLVTQCYFILQYSICNTCGIKCTRLEEFASSFKLDYLNLFLISKQWNIVLYSACMNLADNKDLHKILSPYEANFWYPSLVCMNSYCKVSDSDILFSQTFILSKSFKLNLKGQNNTFLTNLLLNCLTLQRKMQWTYLKEDENK